MTIWRPSLPNPEIPLYQAIANAIADDVVSGRLAEGERLPPQRDLADELKVALTTVTRGYTEAERRGLVSGEVGRGTFVRRQESFHLRRAELEPTAVDLTMNSLLPYPMGRELADRMADVFSKGDAWSVLDYQPHYGSCRQREAGARLVERVGVDASAERVLVTSGAQHAMAVVFSTLANPGDLVLTGELIYSGMKSLANFLHIRLRGLLMDEEGIRPDALEAACATTEAKALYCMPTLQNPTTAVMSEKRRQEIVAIAEAYGLAVVEDDSYGFLLPDVKALGAYATKQHFYYLTGTSKSLAPGLRIGFLHAPSSMVDRLAAAISATTFIAAPPMAEVVASWIADGTADKVMEWKRGEVRKRQQQAKKILSRFDYRAHVASPHGWLTLPEPWCASDFVSQARMGGVLVAPADDFAAGRLTNAHAIRLCLGPMRDRRRLDRALRTLVEILDEPQKPCCSVV